MVARAICSWCAGGMTSPVCGAETATAEQEYCCTRIPGHRGDHVACGTYAHAVHEWPRDAAENPPAEPTFQAPELTGDTRE
jgi:hypothetical protein